MPGKAVGRAKAGPECEAYRKRFFSERAAPVLRLPDLPGGPDKEGPKAPGDSGKKFGHSAQGDHFSEGRRRQAKLWGETGRVRFPTSTKSAEAQKFFEQGLGQIHGYDYSEAERSFRQALKLDPDFAMAYWGLAMSTGQYSPRRASAFMKDLQAKLPKLREDKKVDARELLWIDAAAAYVKEDGSGRFAGKGETPHVKALRAIIKGYPDDIEAKAFLGHELMGQFGGGPVELGEGGPVAQDPALTVRSSRKALENRIAAAEKIDALYKEVLKVEPLHPVHHYRIHLWDGVDSRRALDSADVLGITASSIGHMWHMPGHTFSDLGKWAPAVWNQEASARVDNKRLEDLNLFPHEHGDYAHNHGWLVRNMGFLGMGRRAVEMAKKMIELPSRRPGGYGAAREGFEVLVETLRTYERWDEAVELAATPYLATTSPEQEEQKQFLLGLAYANTGKTKELGESIRALHCLRDLAAEPPPPGAAPKGLEELLPPGAALPMDGPDSSTAGEMALHLRTWEAILDKRPEEARALFKARRESSRYATPSLLDDVRLAVRLGRPDEAKQRLKDHLEAAKGPEAVPLALLTELQWRGGDKKAAREGYRALAKLMGPAEARDAEAAPFRRLLAVPALAKLGHIGTGAPLVKEDARHPRLDKLGPLHWTPPTAPALAVKDAKGKAVSLDDYRGKAVLVVFNLGTECPHCNQQLNALAKRSTAFRDAGIEVLVVTNENKEKFEKSVAALTEGPDGKKRPMPFRYTSDAGLDAFRAWQVYDDFENTPLHGMYLVDSQGRQRWRDVSHDAVTELDAVLTESRRLLRFP